jgi:hypothetical protein
MSKSTRQGGCFMCDHVDGGWYDNELKSMVIKCDVLQDNVPARKECISFKRIRIGLCLLKRSVDWRGTDH